jgi:hypothetical protein
LVLVELLVPFRFILADRGANLTILNRHSAAARGLADKTFHYFRKEAAALELNDKNLKTAWTGPIFWSTRLAWVCLRIPGKRRFRPA